MTERKMLSARVPKELRRLVNADERDNQEIVEAALWREFGGKRMGAIERRMKEKERRITMVEKEKEEREGELETLRNELEALRSKHDSKQAEKEDKFATATERLEGVQLDPNNPGVQKQAEKLDVEVDTLIEEVEKRREQ